MGFLVFYFLWVFWGIFYCLWVFLVDLLATFSKFSSQSCSFGEAVAFQPWRNMPSSFLPTWLEYAWVRWFASGPCQTLLGLRHFCEESFPSSSRCTRFHKAGWGESFWIVCWYEAVWRRLRTFCVWTSIFFVWKLCVICVWFVWKLCVICVEFVWKLCCTVKLVQQINTKINTNYTI